MHTHGQIDAQALVTLAEAAERTGLSPTHLRTLARARTLWALKKGKAWLTTEAALQQYLATNPKPGPKSVSF